MYRQISDKIKKLVEEGGKVLVLIGGRQSGKTTLLKNTFPEATYINLEKSDYIEIFNSRDLEKIKSVIKQEGNDGNNLLILDEVQRLTDPGMVAKLIHDELKEVKLIISGSSALEIANKASESLAGRKHLVELYPLTFQEKLIQTERIKRVEEKKDLVLSNNETKVFRDEIIESMRYGMYPNLLNI